VSGPEFDLSSLHDLSNLNRKRDHPVSACDVTVRRARVQGAYKV
jgi:hypothetical protein